MPTMLTCAQCGQSFSVPPSHANKRRFCGSQCRDAWRVDHLLTCEQCGQKFHAPPSHQHHRFCSAACFGLSRRRPLTERFHERAPSSGDGCWEWLGDRDENGYGRLLKGVALGHGYVYAHRLAYELAYGVPPGDRVVRHICDNPSCVRPDHLVLGSQAENVADRVERGRQHRGERTGGVKLTAKQVIAIRQAFATGTISASALGRAYGVSRQTVRDAVNRVTWTHLP